MLSVNFSPFPVLETKRLLLRNISYEDTPALVSLRSHPKVMSYLDREPFRNTDEARAHIEMLLDNLQKNEGILWVMALKEAPETMIGSLGFFSMNKEHYRTETGYMLHPDYWNKGYMKEALLAIIDYAFEYTGIHSIEANINPENEPSAKVLEACGFIKEAYFRENYYFNGRFKDTIIYSRIKGYPKEGIDIS